MDRRAQRYDDYQSEEKPIKSRTSKNEYLYDEINSKIGYEEIVNLDSHSNIDLTNLASSSNREDYQKIKDIKMFMKQEEEEQEIKYEPPKPKEYDINVILEDAKKNRIKFDELEKKRKLKENSYVKMADLNDKYDDEYRVKPEIDEEELTNLINTITSHNLIEEIKKAEEEQKASGKTSDENEDILSDLLATSANQIITDGIADEYTRSNRTTAHIDDTDDTNKVDNSFYTKSMDLSDQDFELSEEIERENKIKLKITLIVIVLLILIGVVVFFILKSKGIIKL